MVALAKFDTRTRANQGVEIQLKDLRTGKPAGAFITIIGQDSDRFQEVKTEQARELADSMSGERPTAAMINAMTCRTLAACTLGWRGLDGPDGPLQFSVSAAEQLYRDYPAIRDQVNEEIADRANFVLA